MFYAGLKRVKVHSIFRQLYASIHSANVSQRHSTGYLIMVRNRGISQDEILQEAENREPLHRS